MNINDPAGVSALLEQLKSSTVWQELTAAKSNVTPFPESTFDPKNSTTGEMEESAESITSREPTSNFGGTSVASLLSQLKPLSAGPVSYERGVQNASVPPPPPRTSYPRAYASASVAPLEPPIEDRRQYTFRESLPVLSELVENPSLVEAVKKVWVITGIRFAPDSVEVDEGRTGHP